MPIDANVLVALIAAAGTVVVTLLGIRPQRSDLDRLKEVVELLPKLNAKEDAAKNLAEVRDSLIDRLRPLRTSPFVFAIFALGLSLIGVAFVWLGAGASDMSCAMWLGIALVLAGAVAACLTVLLQRRVGRSK